MDVLLNALNTLQNQWNILFDWLNTLSHNHAVVVAAAIQTIAVVTIGFIAYRGVKKQIREHDMTAQRQTTLSAIFNHEFHNPDWRKCKNHAMGMLLEHKNWPGDPRDAVAAAEHLSPEDRVRREQTLIFLNYYELIAIGIRKRAIHEDMYETWFKAGYIETWKISKEFVAIRRGLKSRSKACTNFEHVACTWQRGKHVQRRRSLVELLARLRLLGNPPVAH